MKLRVLASGIVALSLSLHFALAQPAGDDHAARVAAARGLMAVSGSSKQFDEVMPLLGRQLEQAFVALAPQHSSQLPEVMSQILTRIIARKGELIDRIAAIYAEHMTAADLQAMTRFYQSDVGARFVAAQSEVAKRSAIEGQRWGEAVGREIEAEMRRELKKREINL